MGPSRDSLMDSPDAAAHVGDAVVPFQEGRRQRLVRYAATWGGGGGAGLVSDVKMWRAGCSVSCIRKREYQRSPKTETAVGKIVKERAEKTGQKAPKNPEMRN